MRQPVHHHYNTFQAIRLSYIAGDRHIAASDFFIVRQEVGDGNIRQFLDVLLNYSKARFRHYSFFIAGKMVFGVK